MKAGSEERRGRGKNVVCLRESRLSRAGRGREAQRTFPLQTRRRTGERGDLLRRGGNLQSSLRNVYFSRSFS